MDEGRRRVLLIAASTLAARKLVNWDGRPSPALESAIARVHAEDEGCLLYALHETQDGKLVMIEKYESGEAFAAHVKGDGLATWAALIKEHGPVETRTINTPSVFWSWPSNACCPRTNSASTCSRS